MRCLLLWLLPMITLAVSAPAPTPPKPVLDQLTSATFEKSTASGVWLVEYFSPHCGHCRAFESTWMALVSNHSTGISLAQVNCIVNGDLCNKNNINAYPTINLYKNGEFIETYNESRDLDKLRAYVDRHALKMTIADLPQQVGESAPSIAAKPATETPHSPVNILGQVEKLSDATLMDVIHRPDPVLVKFFAPWCGHCKKLAPIYAKLAMHLKGSVQIAEVDCDQYPKICKAQDIKGYPTLKWFPGDGSAGVEYTGKRNGEAMREFIDKAVKSPVTPLENDDDLDALVKTNNVVYLLLHAADDIAPLNMVKQFASRLLGSVPVRTTSTPSLFWRYGLANAPWAVVVLRDGDADEPYAVFVPRDAAPGPALEKFIMKYSIPSSLELSSESFQRVMNAEHKPLVVIAPFNAGSLASVMARSKELAKKWRVRKADNAANAAAHAHLHQNHEHEQEPHVSREVIFTWMDDGKWGKWLKGMYAMRLTDETVRAQHAILADHAALSYYDKTLANTPLNLATSASLFAVIEAVNESEPSIMKLRKSSQGRVEQWSAKVSEKLQTGQVYAVAHPIQAFSALIAFFVLVFWGLRRALRHDGYHELGREKRRLD